MSFKEKCTELILRLRCNFNPAFRGTGARVRSISSDLSHVEVVLPLNWRTRNYVGCIFGGSIYSAVDPFYMLMFIKLLGKDYVVWDKAATIDFKKPGRNTLRASFSVDKEMLEDVRSTLRSERTCLRSYPVELRNEQEEVCALVEKTLYFTTRENARRKK